MNIHIVSTINVIAYKPTHLVSNLLSIDKYANKVMQLSPSAYFRLGESSGTIAVNEVYPGTRDGIYTNSPTLGTTGLLSFETNTAVTFASASSQGINISSCFSNVSSGISMTISLIFKTTSVNAVNTLVAFHDKYSDFIFVIGTNAAGQIRTRTDGTSEILAGTGYNDGLRHSLAVTIHETGLGDILLDGVVIGLGVVPAYGNFNYIYQVFIGQEFDSNYYDGVIDEVAFFNNVTNADLIDIYNAAINEYLSISDSLTYSENIVAMRDIINIASNMITNVTSASNTYILYIVLSETITASQKLYILIRILIQEVLTATENIEAIGLLTNHITNLLTNTNLTSTQLTMVNELHNFLTLVDSGFINYLLSASNDLSVSDTTTVVATYYKLLQEVITQSSTISYSVTIISVLNENIVSNQLITAKSIFNALLSEQIYLGAGLITLGNEGTYTFVANTKTLGLSEYIGYNFTSMSEDLACNSTGIYSLNDDTDAEVIEAEIKTGLLDFGTSKHKQVPYAYLGLTNSGDMILSTVSMANGVRKERLYKLGLSTTATDTRRVQLGKGVKSDLWQFSLTNVSGADFNLDELEILPLVLTRRI